MSSAAALLFLTDLQEGVCSEAARQGLSRFGNGLALAAASRPESLPLVGLFSLARNANTTRIQLQVKLRPSPFLLGDWHLSVGKLAKGSGASGGGEPAQVALALQNMLDFFNSPAPERSRVLLLCDRLYDDLLLFEHPLQTAKLKSIGIDVMALSSDLSRPGIQAAAEGWRALQAAHPSTLSFTLVEVGDRLAFDNLAARLLQRYAASPPLAVSLQFQVPLLGNLCGVSLRAEIEVCRLSHAFEHGSLCPCHRLATGPPQLVCGTTGAVLDPARCEKDLQAVQVGPTPAGLLRFKSPLNIGLASAGHATLKVLERAKWGDLNPALLFGSPITLRADETFVTIVTEAAAGMQDVTSEQVLTCITEHLSSEDEVLLAASTTDLESGQPGLFKLYYILLPSDDGALVAKRIASAEELAMAPMRATPGPQPLPDAAIRRAIRPALGQLPLGKLDSFGLTTTCHQTIEMLVRNSKPTQKTKPRA